MLKFPRPSHAEAQETDSQLRATHNTDREVKVESISICKQNSSAPSVDLSSSSSALCVQTHPPHGAQPWSVGAREARMQTHRHCCLHSSPPVRGLSPSHPHPQHRLVSYFHSDEVPTLEPKCHHFINLSFSPFANFPHFPSWEGKIESYLFL